MTYNAIKRVIESSHYDKSDIMNKLDIFFIAGRITEDQYKELSAMVEKK